MKDIVTYLYASDRVLQYLFHFERQDIIEWCSKILRMGVCATTFDTLIFSYIMRLNVVVIEKFINGFSGNNMYVYLQQLRLPDVFPNKPAIHVYFHQLGRPLEITNNSNHFAYLKSPSGFCDESRSNNDAQNRQRYSIISQESEAFDAHKQSTIASRLVSTCVIQTLSKPSTLPILVTQHQSSSKLPIITQESEILEK